MVDEKWATAFASEWIEAWNSHDLDRILSHYTDDFEMRSPLIQERMNEPSGILQGKEAVRPYWAIGLRATPPLKFELVGVHLGVDGLAILYRSVGRRMVIEVLTLNNDGEISRGAAMYGGLA